MFKRLSCLALLLSLFLSSACANKTDVDTSVFEVESVTCDTLLSNYASEISSLSQDRAALISENISLGSKLDSYKSEASALRQTITGEGQQIKNLESQVSELSSWQSDAISWIQENYSEDTTQPPSSDIDALNARIADLQSEVESLKQELADKQVALEDAINLSASSLVNAAAGTIYRDEALLVVALADAYCLNRYGLDFHTWYSASDAASTFKDLRSSSFYSDLDELTSLANTQPLWNSTEYKDCLIFIITMLGKEVSY